MFQDVNSAHFYVLLVENYQMRAWFHNQDPFVLLSIDFYRSVVRPRKAYFCFSTLWNCHIKYKGLIGILES